MLVLGLGANARILKGLNEKKYKIVYNIFG
jgi:hypothetical protein